MDRTKFEELGDKMKSFEGFRTSSKFDPSKPLLARLDGRAFHTFTKGLKRPYDERFSKLMKDTASFLVEKTHADLAYTQSDEISLFWRQKTVTDETSSSFLFDGKKQKLVSVLASIATSKFSSDLKNVISEKQNEYPTFDCRVWQVPSEVEVKECFEWRMTDAERNAVSMASSFHFSHSKLHGVSVKHRLKMLKEIGVNFDEYPSFFKRGVFLKKEVRLVNLSDEELILIPEKHRPTGPILRNFIIEVENPW